MDEQPVESITDEPVESIADDAPEQPVGSDGPGQETAPVGDGGTEGKTEGEDGGVGGEEPYTLTAPEGFAIGQDVLKSFTESARGAKLTKEQAEAMLGWQKKIYDQNVEAQKAMRQEVISGWQKQMLNDAEFGGKNYRKTIADARYALKVYDQSGELKKLLKDMDADYHPAIIKALALAGAGIREHELTRGNSHGGRGEDKPLEDRMWPGM